MMLLMVGDSQARGQPCTTGGEDVAGTTYRSLARTEQSNE